MRTGVQGCNKVTIGSELMNGGKKRRNELNLAGFATETALFLSLSFFTPFLLNPAPRTQGAI